MSRSRSTRWRLAGDPGTAPGLLQSLAQHYPQTRVAVAGNPVTYPALLQWLGQLGDPAVSAAVAARVHSPAPPPPPPPPPMISGDDPRWVDVTVTSSPRPSTVSSTSRTS